MAKIISILKLLKGTFAFAYVCEFFDNDAGKIVSKRGREILNNTNRTVA